MGRCGFVILHTVRYVSDNVHRCKFIFGKCVKHHVGWQIANERLPTDRSEESNLLDRIIASASFARRASHLRFAALSKSERSESNIPAQRARLRSRTSRTFCFALRTMDPMCTQVEQLIPNVRRLGMRRRWWFFTDEAELPGREGRGGKEVKNSEHAETGAHVGWKERGVAEPTERGAKVKASPLVTCWYICDSIYRLVFSPIRLVIIQSSLSP